jgi:hypothetical protein
MIALVMAAALGASVEVPPGLAAWLDARSPIVDGWIAPPKGAQLRAMARGRVESVAPTGLTIVHHVFENATRREVRFVASGLEAITVRAGQDVEQGALLGSGKRATALIDGQTPTAFLSGRPPVFNPLSADRAFVVDVDARRLVALEKGTPVASWGIAIGQAEGAKQVRGDLKTPRGMFFVTERYHGKFSGDWADFYGEYWVKLSYPNPFDAARGLDAGVITASQAASIGKAWGRRELTLQGTKLGGGIGFHSWASKWDADAGTLMSFGCVVLHPEDVADFYARIRVGDLVVLR